MNVPSPRTPTRGKQTVVALLVGLNVCLALALASLGTSMSQVQAQTAGKGGAYLCVTAKPAGQNYDVLYLLDQTAHKLHAFYPGLPQNKQLTRADARDVKKDFGS